MREALARLRARKLGQWALAYLAGAWLLLQILSLLAQPFAWPNLVLRAATVLLGVGFFAALVLAWYHGERGEQRVTSMEILMLSALLIIAGTAVAWVGGGGRSARPAPAAAASPSGSDAAPTDRRSVAVLPFASLSAEPENAYFASGIHDEILTQLSKVGALNVISRTSVMQYAAGARNLREIGAALGAGSIVEGSVQRVGNRVRVTAQLIDARTDRHLWAERYDRDLSDVFTIQTEIAERVAGALEANLTAGERARIERRPTGSPEAYDLYLRARDYQLRTGMPEGNLRAAEKLYAEVLALDPDFALARSSLARLHASMYWFKYDPSEARRESARREAETALRQAPDLPEARLAMGFAHYYGYRAYDRALREFEAALAAMPGSADIHAAIGYLHRRMGSWQLAVEALERAVGLDPGNAQGRKELGDTYNLLRRYPDAMREYGRALALAPDYYDAASERGEALVRWTGETDSLRAAVDVQARVDKRALSSATFDRYRLAIWARRHDEALEALRSAPGDAFEFQVELYPHALLVGWAQAGRGDTAAARVAFEQARVQMERALRQRPGDPRLHLAHGFALAALGRREQALAAARRVGELMPESLDAFWSTRYAMNAAKISAQVGDADGAVRAIERLLPPAPGFLTVHDLRLDPLWDPIREDPRFRRLSARRAG